MARIRFELNSILLIWLYNRKERGRESARSAHFIFHRGMETERIMRATWEFLIKESSIDNGRRRALTMEFSNNLRHHERPWIIRCEAYIIENGWSTARVLLGHRSRSISEKFGDAGVDALDRTCDRTRVVDAILFLSWFSMHFIAPIYLHFSIFALMYLPRPSCYWLIKAP